MYSLSRHVTDFCIAGFTYWDGVEALAGVKIGSRLVLSCERDNPYDPEAVALYFGNAKLGYIPKSKNKQISQFLFFGHEIFEAFVCQIDLDEHPERQIRVAIKLIDSR